MKKTALTCPLEFIRNADNVMEREFWSRVGGAGDDCWPWRGSVGTNGYGLFFYDGERFSAHRVAYMYGNGPIPDGHHICHRCDMPICCNPTHLWSGTQAENMYDKWKKGRTGWGGNRRVSNKSVGF